MNIIRARRANPDGEKSEDIWNLMGCIYKDGKQLPDQEIAYLMIALLMAGQISPAVKSSWIILHLASEPSIAAELYEEQIRAAILRPSSVQSLTVTARATGVIILRSCIKS